MATKITDNLIKDPPRWKKIASINATNVASVDLLNVFVAGKDYMLVLDDIANTTLNGDIYCQLGNAPSSWVTTGYESRYMLLANGTIITGGSTAWVGGTVNIGDSGGVGGSARVWINDPASTTNMQTMVGELAGYHSNSGLSHEKYGVIRRTAGTAYNSMRIVANSGSILRVTGNLYEF